MMSDLELNIGSRYNIITMIFFVPYVIFQFPATAFVRTLGVRAFLGGICLVWGIVMIGFGLATKWYHMIPLRILLGALEAGFFPACVYLLSTWYIRCKRPTSIASAVYSTDFQ